ncbi:MAG TPA: hypothetical protein VGL53_20535, partial [Bryobacteraceae bacterium]
MKHRVRASKLTLFSLLLALVFFSSAASAQVLYGSLTGSVTDASAAAVVGAKVETLNVNTG